MPGAPRRSLALVAVVSLAACAETPVTPIPDAARRNVTAVSGDVQGLKYSDTSKLGARGSGEGAQLGALQGAAYLQGAGGLLGLAVMGVGAIVGSAKGASEAQAADIVDQTRGQLHRAIDDTDFTELLRARLSQSKSAGDIEIINVTSQAVPLDSVANNARSPDHYLAIEYRLGLHRHNLVNPEIGVLVLVHVRVRDPGRNQQIHQAIWAWCGEPRHFVQMAANDAAAVRAQIDQAATVLAEAIPYDLYLNRKPRALRSTRPPCMDFADLPSAATRAVRRPGLVTSGAATQ
jgi:hypothetical protein